MHPTVWAGHEVCDLSEPIILLIVIILQILLISCSRLWGTQRSRGTGPRATGQERGSPRHASVSGSGDPELQSPATILLILEILKILLLVQKLKKVLTI